MAENTYTKLYLFRHAESETNTNPDIIGGRSNEAPLTTRGEEQASKLGAYLLSRGIFPDAIFASPAKRTRQTAKISLGIMGVEIDVNLADEIQELSQGNSEGKPRIDTYTSDVLAEIDRKGKNFKLPGGESMNDVGSRMHNWVSDTVAGLAERQDSIRNMFVYTHGGAITYLASRLEGWSHPDTYDFQKTVENTSISRFDVDRNEIIVDYLNRTPE